MNIGFLAPDGEFLNAILEGLQRGLVEDTLTRWRPEDPPHALDIEVLFAVGVVDRPLMESMPKLGFHPDVVGWV